MQRLNDSAVDQGRHHCAIQSTTANTYELVLTLIMIMVMVLMVVGELTVLHKYLELEALLLGGGYPQQVATLEQAYDIVREIYNLCDFLSLKQIVCNS